MRMNIQVFLIKNIYHHKWKSLIENDEALATKLQVRLVVQNGSPYSRLTADYYGSLNALKPKKHLEITLESFFSIAICLRKRRLLSI